jgi:DHA3 family macrolide efflux protein-like MFS transporter
MFRLNTLFRELFASGGMFASRGMRIFTTIWAGQVVSMLGTAMTRFALLVWAYQQTGQATTLALLGFFSFITYVILSPLGGVWADRLDRRLVMIVGDCGAGVITILLLGLYATGGLHIWHLYAGEALTGVFEAFQLPAYNASMAVLVPRKHLVRANGMRSLGYDTTRILAPAFAGLLLAGIGLAGVMIIDIVTFLLAVGTLLLVRIPRPQESAIGRAAQGQSIRESLTFGVRYIAARPGLLGLTIVFMLIHLFAALTYFGVLPAMVLARSGGDELVLSGVQSMLGIGGVIGGLVLAVWGGPRRKIHGVLMFCAASFLFGDMLFALGRTPLAWSAAALATTCFIPFITSAHNAIWQTKVPQDVQGRVLSTTYALQESTRPLGYLITGPLADRIMEPLMMPGGGLAGVFGPLVGTGPGAGMALMFMMTAVLGTLACLGGYLFPPLRNVDDLPDVAGEAVADVPVGAVVEAVAGD